MKKLVAILTLWIALEPISALAQKTVIGAGISYCGAWTEARRAKGFNARIGEMWALGYLSGLISMTDDRDILVQPDAAGLFAWIDKYCREHPLNRLANATDALGAELMRNFHR